MASLFMDASSELIHSLLPVFMSSVLGASIVTIGFVEGIAEATAAITKVFSGTLSDCAGRRKPLMVFGYGLAAATKPLFPLASSLTWVFLGRFIDRIGKGIRGAPRDALVADVTPPALRGTAYGLRQALDSVGAFVGPLLAVLLMRWFADDIRTVLWFGVLPAFVAVALLVIFIREPERHSRPEQARAPGREPGRDSAGHPEQDDAAVRRAPSLFSLAMLQQLPLRYWLIVQLSALFTLARFSEAFLVLRAQNIGLAVAYIPAVMIVMNICYAGIAYPGGVVADRIGHRHLLQVGLLMLIAADLVLARATSPAHVFVGTALWGLHMGLTQGVLSKLVADTAPAALRGTAFGVFNLVSGVALLLASAIAGALWSATGPSGTFIAGAVFALLALAGLGLAGRSAANAA